MLSGRSEQADFPTKWVTFYELICPVHKHPGKSSVDWVKKGKLGLPQGAKYQWAICLKGKLAWLYFLNGKFSNESNAIWYIYAKWTSLIHIHVSRWLLVIIASISTWFTAYREMWTCGTWVLSPVEDQAQWWPKQCR